MTLIQRNTAFPIFAAANFAACAVAAFSHRPESLIQELNAKADEDQYDCTAEEVSSYQISTNEFVDPKKIKKQLDQTTQQLIDSGDWEKALAHTVTLPTASPQRIFALYTLSNNSTDPVVKQAQQQLRTCQKASDLFYRNQALNHLFANQTSALLFAREIRSEQIRDHSIKELFPPFWKRKQIDKLIEISSSELKDILIAVKKGILVSPFPFCDMTFPIQQVAHRFLKEGVDAAFEKAKEISVNGEKDRAILFLLWQNPKGSNEKLIEALFSDQSLSQCVTYFAQNKNFAPALNALERIKNLYMKQEALRVMTTHSFSMNEVQKRKLNDETNRVEKEIIKLEEEKKRQIKEKMQSKSG